MTSAFGDMLRITPRCQVARCRRNGSVHVRLSNPSWKKDQAADICPTHLPEFSKKAEAAGCSLTIA